MGNGLMVAVAAAMALAGCDSTKCAKGPAIAARNATVVWNPETGLTERGKAWTKSALTDLTNVLAKVTGRCPAAYVEGTEPADAKDVIYLGDTKAARAAGVADPGLRRGEWRIRSVPGKVYIWAKAGLGTSYGMSDFAETFCRYWFLTPEGDDPFDFNPALTIPCVDRTVRPAIYNARIYTAENRLNYGDFARRRRTPSYPPDEIEGEERLCRRVRECHSSFNYLPPEKYFKDHPEWYSLLNGKRQHAPVGQICMSNPEARAECLKNLLAFVKRDREENPTDYPKLYDFTQQDNMSELCQCENCRRIIAKYTRGKLGKQGENYYGGDAGLQLEFINWIATEAAKVYPDITIRTFAYVSTETPPKPGTIRPAKNVRIWWCDLYGESEHHRPLVAEPFNRLRGEQVAEWLLLAEQVEIWDYMLYGGSYNGDYPEVSPDAIAADAKFFRDRGLKSIFMEAERNAMLPQPFYELNYYLMSVFYTDPDADLEERIRTYCRVYGKGAAKMLEAIGFLRAEIAAHPAATHGEWHQRVCGWRTRENWERFRALVKAAYDAETPGPARARIARVLSSASRELIRVYGQIPSAASAREAAKRDYERYSLEYVRTTPLFDRARTKMAADVRQAIALLDLRFKDIPEELAGVPDSEIRCADFHRFCGSPNGKAMPDPDCETGKAMVWKHARPDAEHAGFPVPCGMYDATLKDGQAFRIRAEAADWSDEKYHWVKLGKGCVGSQGVFWMPGDWHMTFRFGDWYIQKDGLPVDPNWYDVYLSVKFTGPAYNPGSKSPNGIWMGRLMLRRTAPPAK